MTPRDPPRDPPRDDDLAERLDELEDVLTELRRDLRREERDGRTGRRERRPFEPPRPPRISELLRFTEQYTIPTLIALLETTIKSLKLLQGTLRLADPDRSALDDGTRAGSRAADAAGDRLAGVRDEATTGLARSLSELQTALSEADLPEDAASRSILEEARDLTAEIETRIQEGRRDADAARDRRLGRTNGRDDENEDAGVVHIDVQDPDEAAERDASESVDTDGDHDANDSAAPEVDVESELESIKKQLDDPEKEPDSGGDEADGEDAEIGGTEIGDAESGDPENGDHGEDGSPSDAGDR